MSTAREQELISEIERLRRETDAAEAALTEERFRDVPRLARGAEVLVQRRLFGKTRLWPARVVGVHLDYVSGTDTSGEPWEQKNVSYSVQLQLADGTGWRSDTEGFWAREVQLKPESGVES